MIRSNDCSRARRLAVSPSRTTSTSYPSSFRSSSSPKARGGSSSTTKMRAIFTPLRSEEDSKRAADTGLTVDMHLPAVGCNNVLNHRQAEARTFGPGNLSTGGPNEFFEYPFLLMWVNPQPPIAYAN